MGGPESKASAFRPASTIARSLAGRLITVAHTKRLGSKALVGGAVAVEVATIVGVHEDVRAALQFGVDAARRLELERAGADHSRALASCSGSDPAAAARLQRVKGGADRRHERHQILHAIVSGANQHNAETQCRDALLELDAAVHRDEGIILAVHAAQRLAVLDPGPAATANGVYAVTRKFRSRADG